MEHISIRTRLIAAFLGVVFLSLSGISLMLLLANTRAAQQENERQLMTVASYKGKALQEWTNALTAELGNALVGENMITNVEAVLYPKSAEGSAEVQATLHEQMRSQLRQQMVAIVTRSQYYDEFMLLNTDGEVALSTARAREGQDFSQS